MSSPCTTGYRAACRPPTTRPAGGRHSRNSRRSSRRVRTRAVCPFLRLLMERETQRNVELMWLTGRLMPDFKTLANFRKDNGPAIRNVCRQFIVLCRKLDLFSQAIVAIDGSKFKAVNNRDKNFTRANMQRRMAHIE